ncbi:hypothetical protein M885DRAFT_558333 [Pelagophyceae sp. CCMP2097]|nr:hypothetical protein M885DRAFT_558333 [Pelagophyceae sp. CCMP2097]
MRDDRAAFAREIDEKLARDEKSKARIYAVLLAGRQVSRNSYSKDFGKVGVHGGSWFNERGNEWQHGNETVPNLKLCAQQYKKHIFDMPANRGSFDRARDNFDVFVHSWSPEAEAEIRTLYEPKSASFEHNDKFVAAIDACSTSGNPPQSWGRCSLRLSFTTALQMVLRSEGDRGEVYRAILWLRADALVWNAGLVLPSYDISKSAFSFRDVGKRAFSFMDEGILSSTHAHALLPLLWSPRWDAGNATNVTMASVFRLLVSTVTPGVEPQNTTTPWPSTCGYMIVRAFHAECCKLGATLACCAARSSKTKEFEVLCAETEGDVVVTDQRNAAFKSHMAKASKRADT